MRILVLGTSNSILKDGWVEGLRSSAPPEVEIVNASVGASPAAQFGFHCAQGFAEYDLVLIEPVVNDENIHHFVGSRACFEQVMFEIFATIAAQSRLVAIGFTNARFEVGGSWVFEFYRALAERVGGRFIDAVAFAQGFPLPHFSDENHLSSRIAQAFGRQLALDLTTLTFGPRYTQSFQTKFTSLDIGDLGRFSMTERKSALYSGHFAILTPETRIVLPREANLIGIQIDASATYGYLSMEGSAGRRCISLRYDTGTALLRARFVPIQNGFMTQSLTVSFPREDALASVFENPTAAPRPLAVSLSKLLFWDHQPRLHGTASGET